MNPDKASFSVMRLFVAKDGDQTPESSCSRHKVQLCPYSSLPFRKSNDEGLQTGWLYRWILIVVTTLWIFMSVFPVAAAYFEQPDDPIPLLAYYYIWFDRGSWDRAKSDSPVLGSYSSDDENVMRQHIAWAKQVGIDGFIVSWKSTDQLNRRLEQLITIADEADFQLAIIYQGLNFERDPLPVERITEDLQYFKDTYAESEVFNIYERPLVIWSGTWEFSREQISEVTKQHRDHLLILASERQIDTYSELAEVVDGNAYYWSSVDPERFPGYQEKLDQMGETVHENRGIWIAPAAPGFDARLIEGSRVIDRKGGETLVRELSAAYASSPDAVGMISWNEFSENTHIEPSRNFGMRSLEVLSELNETPPPEVVEFDSSEPAEISLEPNFGRVISFSLLGIVILLSLLVIVRRGLLGGRR